MYKFKWNDSEWIVELLDSIATRNEYRKVCYATNQEYDEKLFIKGFCDYTQHRIVLNKYLCEQEIESTFMHELTHCWLYVMGFTKEFYEEEELCNIMCPLTRFVTNITHGFMNVRKQKTEEEQKTMKLEPQDNSVL